MLLSRDGLMRVVMSDGSSVSERMSKPPFASSSAIAVATVALHRRGVQLLTVHGDQIWMELPDLGEMAPHGDRPTVYLDQNHWSTLSFALHEPNRVSNSDELAAAQALIALAQQREILLPISAGHMSETCKQADHSERYRRGLTMAQLSAGWQFADPIAIRSVELARSLGSRYHGVSMQVPAAVTLESGAIFVGDPSMMQTTVGEFTGPFQFALHAARSVVALVDVLLDADNVPVEANSGWARKFEEFADFLAGDPTEREMKRQRTNLMFLVDLKNELARAAGHASVTPEQLSDWVMVHSNADVAEMPALGLYREVMHEKLCNTTLRWETNDLTDMIYLTAATGYCDHVVGERSHVSHIRQGLKRLGRSNNVYLSLRDLLPVLDATAEGCDVGS